MKNNQILEYHLSVDDALKNGHPIQQIEMNFQRAAETMDRLHAEFPENTVRLYEVRKWEIANFEGVKPEPKCPHGCTGTSDERPVVFRNTQGNVQCRICGYLGG